MMKIIASLLVIVGLIAVVLYFKPTSGASDVFNSALHETNSPQTDTSSSLSKLKEPTQLKNVSLNSNHSQPVSADAVLSMTQKVILRFNRLIQKKIQQMK